MSRHSRRGALHGRLALLENRQAASRAVPLAVVYPDGHVIAAPGRRLFASEADLLAATANQAKPPFVIRLDPTETPEDATK